MYLPAWRRLTQVEATRHNTLIKRWLGNEISIRSESHSKHALWRLTLHGRGAFCLSFLFPGRNFASMWFYWSVMQSLSLRQRPGRLHRKRNGRLKNTRFSCITFIRDLTSAESFQSLCRRWLVSQILFTSISESFSRN